MASLRGWLFVLLAVGLGGVAVAAWRADVLVIAIAAGVLAAWMADLALRELGVRGRRR